MHRKTALPLRKAPKSWCRSCIVRTFQSHLLKKILKGWYRLNRYQPLLCNMLIISITFNFYKLINTFSPSTELIFTTSQRLCLCLYFFIEWMSFIKSFVLISIDGCLLFIILVAMVAVNRLKNSVVGKMIRIFFFSDLINTFIFILPQH